MQSTYVELEYRRHEDGLPVTLVAALPAVRAISIGGDPSDLRLPGTPLDAVYARIVPVGDHFRLVPVGEHSDPEPTSEQCKAEPVREPSGPESAGNQRGMQAAGDPPGKDPAAVAATLRLNGRPVPPAGVQLEAYDTISLSGYRLTFHEGEPPADPPLIETHLRWKTAPPHGEEEWETFDPGAKAHIDEFELSTRALLQARRFADIRRRAEDEIQRLLRAPDADALEGYAEYLWWVRVRMAREVADPRTAEIAREAYDLFPESGPVMVSCGLSFFAEANWKAARAAFERVLRGRGRRVLPIIHDARVGRILADHLAGLTEAERGRDAFPAAISRQDWDVPRIRLHVPGDEVLLWRIAWHGRVFGGADRVRFVYCGKAPASPTGARGQPGTPPNPPAGEAPAHDSGIAEFHRWEIHDMQRQLIWRRLLEIPTLPLADPSLALEVAGMRNALSQYSAFTGLFLDRSSDAAADQPPVLFDGSALAALPATVADNQVACARLSQRSGKLRLDIVLRPQASDVVYRQGVIQVAVEGSILKHYGGSVLSRSPQHGLHLQTAAGSRVAVKYRGPSILHGRVPKLWVLVLIFILISTLIRLVLGANR